MAASVMMAASVRLPVVRRYQYHHTHKYDLKRSTKGQQFHLRYRLHAGAHRQVGGDLVYGVMDQFFNPLFNPPIETLADRALPRGERSIIRLELVRGLGHRLMLTPQPGASARPTLQPPPAPQPTGFRVRRLELRFRRDPQTNASPTGRLLGRVIDRLEIGVRGRTYWRYEGLRRETLLRAVSDGLTLGPPSLRTPLLLPPPVLEPLPVFSSSSPPRLPVRRVEPVLRSNFDTRCVGYEVLRGGIRWPHSGSMERASHRDMAHRLWLSVSSVPRSFPRIYRELENELRRQSWS